MSTYSTNLGLTLIGTGEQAGTWGTTTNTNLGTLLEQAISGYVTQAITDGADTVITIPNGATGVARNMVIELTGALTAARNLIVPTNKKLYFIYNNTTGGFAVTVKVTGLTGVSVPAGAKVVLVSNGTDIVVAENYFASLTLGAPLPVTSGGTGVTTALIPTQTANTGKYLRTSGSATSWHQLDLGTSTFSGVGSISTTTLTISAAYGGALTAGSYITGTGVTAGTMVTAVVSVVNGVGTYTVDTSQTVSSTAITGYADFAGILTPYYGGTGVNNGVNTLTLSGNLTTAGAFAGTASISGVTMTVTAVGSGAVYSGMPVIGTTVALGTVVGTIGTGGTTGTGGTGTYPVNISQTASSQTIVGPFPTTLTVSAPTALTLPTTGTLATLAGTETLTNKTILFPTSATVSAAGTNQGTATAITADNVVITTAASGTGVVLPTAAAGRRIRIDNKGANAVSIYPASGATIDALAANAAISLPVDGVMEFSASSSTQWYSSYNLYTSATAAAGVTSFSAGTTGLSPATATTGAVTLSGILDPDNGGTGINNGSNTLTLSGNFSGTGSIGPSSTTMTITAVSSGAVYAGMLVSGTGVTAGTTVSAFGTGGTTGTGGTGTYVVSASQTVASTTLTGPFPTTLTITAPTTVTLPTTGTLATLAGTETLTNKTIQFPTSASVSAAGTTQATGTALTSDHNVITTAAASSGVVLPTATVGRRIVVENKGANSVKIYPATGAAVDALGANVAISLPVDGVMFFNASSTTQWYSSYNLYTSATAAAGVTSFSAGSTGLSPATATTGAVTLAGTLAVASGGTGVTTSTGSGNVVLSTSPTLTSPTLVTPILGTPTSGTLTNATGLPLTTGVTGTLPVANGGTGVTTSTGSGSVVLSTSPTLVTPILGTPTSGTLTNATGLPLTTGVTGTLPVANGGTGATTLTSAAILRGNGTSAISAASASDIVTAIGSTAVTAATTATNLASGSAGTVPYQSASGTTAMLSAGTAGQVLQSTGAAAPAWVNQPFTRVQVYTTASNTWTVPTGVTSCLVVVYGGGGGGGGGSTPTLSSFYPYPIQTYMSGAAGGGAIALVTSIGSLNSVSSITVTVGSGGAGGNGGTTGNSGSTGSAGGTSSFGTYVSCTGGGAGAGLGVSTTRPSVGSATFSGANVTKLYGGTNIALNAQPAGLGTAGATPGTQYYDGTDWVGAGGGGSGFSGGGGGGTNQTGGLSPVGGVAYGAGSNGTTPGTSGAGGAGGGSTGGSGGAQGTFGGNNGGGGGGGGGVVIFY